MIHQRQGFVAVSQRRRRSGFQWAAFTASSFRGEILFGCLEGRGTEPARPVFSPHGLRNRGGTGTVGFDSREERRPRFVDAGRRFSDLRGVYGAFPHRRLRLDPGIRHKDQKDRCHDQAYAEYPQLCSVNRRSPATFSHPAVISHDFSLSEKLHRLFLAVDFVVDDRALPSRRDRRVDIAGVISVAIHPAASNRSARCAGWTSSQYSHRRSVVLIERKRRPKRSERREGHGSTPRPRRRSLRGGAPVRHAADPWAAPGSRGVQPRQRGGQ